MAMHFETITEVAAKLRSGAITSSELTELLLDRIELLEPTLNAFIAVTPDLARDDARRADAELASGHDRGPLHGIPIAVKDLFATEGTLTTGGSKLHDNWIPDHDATVVDRLRQAGSVLLGKTGLHELAYGVTSINPFFGPIRNPWSVEHDPGGSSGGSAVAVAAGMAYAALGTDTGCSVRQPAHCCGIVGHKPTFGLVSKAGVLDLVWSMDHVGPLTRSVSDSALVLDVIAGHDPADPYSAPRPINGSFVPTAASLDGAVVGVVRRGFFEGHRDVTEIVETALEWLRQSGARIVELDIPDLTEAATAIDHMSAEAAVLHEADLRDRPEAFSDEILAKLRRDQDITAAQYVAAQHFRQGFTARVEELFNHCDVLVAPTATIASSPIDNRPSDYGHHATKNTSIFDFTGQPSVSVPCGFTAAGLPVGLMVTGRLFDDRGVLQFAHSFEQGNPWHTCHPEV